MLSLQKHHTASYSHVQWSRVDDSGPSISLLASKTHNIRDNMLVHDTCHNMFMPFRRENHQQLSHLSSSHHFDLSPPEQSSRSVPLASVKVLPILTACLAMSINYLIQRSLSSHDSECFQVRLNSRLFFCSFLVHLHSSFFLFPPKTILQGVSETPI